MTANVRLMVTWYQIVELEIACSLIDPGLLIQCIMRKSWGMMLSQLP